MAIVTRYFSTAGAGAGDGTTWADRAALFDGSGNWSSVITGFNFNGGDSLTCLCEGGLTYSCAQGLASGIFTSGAPSLGAQLTFVACDSSGAAKAKPNIGWVSAQPTWDATGMPVIETTTNIQTAGLGTFFGFKFTASARTSGAVVGGGTLMSCIVVNSVTGDNSTYGVQNTTLIDSAVQMGPGYLTIVAGCTCYNARLIGHPSGTNGQRRGSESSGGLIRCTVLIGNGTMGIITYVGHTFSGIILVGGDGLYQNSSSESALLSSIIIGSSGYAVRQDGTAVQRVAHCRFRNNTSGSLNVSSTGELLDLGNDTSAGTDADEFVDAANGDYRIKATSSLWGKGIGAGDEIPTPAAIAAAVWARTGRELTA